MKTSGITGLRKIGGWMAGRLKETGYPLAAAAVGVLAIAAPIVISLQLARQQSYNEQSGRAALIAEEVLRRADEATGQIFAAINKLAAAKASDPCSDANISLMGDLAIASVRLRLVGYVSGDVLRCSSIGRFGAGIPVGPPDYVSWREIGTRTTVRFPLALGKKFILATDLHNGYTGVVDPDEELDVFTDQPDIAMGLFAYPEQKLIEKRGAFLPQWMRDVAVGGEAEFSDAGYLIALRRSPKWDFAAYGAVPLSAVDSGLRRAALVEVPIGVVAGAILAWCVFYVSRRQIALPTQMKTGLRRGQFFLNYQPVVDLRTGKWVGAEVLIRWRLPTGRLVRPDLFIPVAEESGLITKVTRRVVDLIATEVGDLFDRYPNFRIAINLSPADLASPATVPLLRNLIERISAKPHNILVEVTERGFISGDLAQGVVHELRASGIKVAVDDFGTGYSSLAYLHTLELDLLKIDKSFVDAIGADAVTSQVLPHIVNIARDLRLETIAEGVEHEAQAKYLLGKQVNFAQGYLFARPMAFKDLSSGLTLHAAPELAGV
jgi:sensor c-di-GMP phosphodiesterase-like protein